MELPVAPASYQPSPFALLRAVQHGRTMLAQTTAQEKQLEGAVAYVNAARPGVALANFAAELSIPADSTAAAVVEAVGKHFAAAHTPCHAWYCSDAQWPPDLARQIQSQGCTVVNREVRLLTHFVAPARPNPRVQIIPGRAAFAETHTVYQGAATAGISVHTRRSSGIDKVAQDGADTHVDHLDEPRLEVFLARLEGKPAGVVGVLTVGSIGLIDHVFVLPDFRRQGIGSALMVHAVGHCARALFSQVIMDVGQGDSARAWLTALGFRPALSYVNYVAASST